MPIRTFDFSEYIYLNHCGKNADKTRIDQLIKTYSDDKGSYTFINTNNMRLDFISSLNTIVLPSHKFTVSKLLREYRIYYFLKHVPILQLYPDKFHLVFSREGIWKDASKNVIITEDFKTNILMKCNTIDECREELFKYGLRQLRESIHLESNFKKLTDSYGSKYMSDIVNDYKREIRKIFTAQPINERIFRYLLGFGTIYDS